MKRGAPRHPKVQTLCGLLKIPLYSAVGILELLWHFTAEFSPQGDIGRYPNESIAMACGWKKNADGLISALIQSGWIDDHGEHRLVIHDWMDHADEATKKRLNRAHVAFVEEQSGTRIPSIYFVLAPSVVRVKIGFTEGSVASRVEALQTGSGEKLVLLGAIPGTRYKESQLHRRWSTLRRDGEWFDVNNAFVSFLEDTVKFGSRNIPNLPEIFRKSPTMTDAGRLPEPEPEPEPEPPPPHKPTSAPTTAAANGTGNGRRRHYPELQHTRTAIVKQGFDDVRDSFVHRLYLASREAAKKGGCNPDLVTDELLARVVIEATKKHQESAGLYLDTVPAIIQTWAETEEK